MHPFLRVCLSRIAFLSSSFFARADQAKILTNHLGYEPAGPKHAVILGASADQFASCTLNGTRDQKSVLTIPAQHVGPVKKWRDWHFWTMDFDNFSTEGTYYLVCTPGNRSFQSYPFAIQHLLLERNTLSDAIYYFKDERSSSLIDQADRHLPFDGASQRQRWQSPHFLLLPA